MEDTQRFDLSRVLREFPLPPMKHGENVQSIRLKRITLIDQSGTDLRIAIAAREQDWSSSATAFFRLTGFENQRGFKITSAEIEIFRCPNPSSRDVEAMSLHLYANGASNLYKYIGAEREMVERYLEYWGILVPAARRDQHKSCLKLLGNVIESSRGEIVPYRLSSADRAGFHELAGAGLVTTPAMPVSKLRFTCPVCDETTITASKLVCTNCGKIDIAEAELHRYSPDYLRLLGKMRKTLSTKTEPPQKSLGENVWLIGEVGSGALKKRLLFIRQLSKPRALKSLLQNWNAYVGNVESIIITTSATRNMPAAIPGIQNQPQFFVFQDAFRFENGNLVAESALADAVRPLVIGGFVYVNGPFTADFGHVLLPGEDEAIKLSKQRATVFKFLWEMKGAPVEVKQVLAVAQGSKESGPGGLDVVFPKANAPGPYRAFKALVERKKGECWLRAEVFGQNCLALNSEEHRAGQERNVDLAPSSR